jgi:hypothetical protein
MFVAFRRARLAVRKRARITLNLRKPRWRGRGERLRALLNQIRW